MANEDNDIDDYDDLPTIGFCAKVETVQKRINERYDALFHWDKAGNAKVHVCTFCDEILMHQSDVNWLPVQTLIKNRECLAWSSVLRDERDRIPAVEREYTYKDPDNLIKPTWKLSLEGLALSPRGIIGKPSNHGNSKISFSCCQTCNNHLKTTKPTTPFYSIVNKNFLGCAPSVLTDLTEVELALIQPVLKHGYCFTYSGGVQKNLKGVMSFFRVEERKVASGIIQVEQMGLNNNIVVLLTGKMTTEQRRKATEKGNGIRTHKCIAAVEWLVANHPKWKGIDLDKLREEFEGKTPVVVDNSKEVESENANVEAEEQFICYVPDGTLDEQFGGFQDPEAFKEYVDAMHQKNFQVTLHMPMTREFLGDNKDDDFLVATNLLVFPYGRCGMFEDRRLKDGSLTSDCEHEGFMRHLSLVSQRVCQSQMFQLILYSQISKWRILKSSRLKLKGERTVDAIANALNSGDLSNAINARRRGDRFAGTFASNAFLKQVDATASALAHTDAAAKKARGKIEAMVHEFGIPSVFLTVNFDDECSFLLQVLSNEEIDDDTPVEDIPEKECADRAVKRREIRIKMPGFAAGNYEMLLNILLEEVIGWDKRGQRPTEKEGLFGMCEALCLALEEQGRKSLHGHMLLWIKHFSTLRKLMFFARREEERNKAKDTVLHFHDRICTTKLFDTETPAANYSLKKSFDHECSVKIVSNRELPVVVSNQSLRNLRHIHGYKHEEGIFAYCPHCTQKWTYEQMVANYVLIHGKMLDNTYNPQVEPELVEDVEKNEKEKEKGPPIPKARMQAKVLEYQRYPDADLNDCPETVINALYNAHRSMHTKNTCFKCNKLPGPKRRAHKHDASCECRMRLPDLHRRYAEIETLKDCNDWYNFRGEPKEQRLVEILPRRRRFDAFQNTSCKPVTESKFACNSNVSTCVDGPVVMYQVKYNTKGTQCDDKAEYYSVELSIKKMGDTRKYLDPDDDRKEAQRRIIRGAFANNSDTVVGAPMAALLVRWGTRFYFSHETVPCPVRDLIKLGLNLPVVSTATYHIGGERTYWENQALHYLCRHEKLEELSPFEFYSQYEICYVKLPKAGKKRTRNGSRQKPIDECLKEGKYRFQADTGHYKHPSALKVGNEWDFCPSGVQERMEPRLISVSQWSFPDTKKFKADIMTCTENCMNKEMENYAQLVLHLFANYRHISELRSPECERFPHITLLQEVWDIDKNTHDNANKLIFSEKNMTYLQNIQDSAYNSLRYKLGDDALQRVTHPFTEDCPHLCEEEEVHEEEGKEDDMIEDDYNHLMEQIAPDERDNLDEDPTMLAAKLQDFSFKHQRHKGKQGCGYDDSMNKATPILENGEAIPEDFVCYGVAIPVETTSPSAENPRARVTHSMKQIVTVYLTRTSSRARAKVFELNPEAQVLEANGSFKSIQNWAKAANLDSKQRRAFESLIAAFLLTFMNEQEDCDEDDDAQLSMADRVKFNALKKTLRKLMGAHVETKRDGDQLICLIHGPGGSGKSTVVNLVIAYAQEYCDLLRHPFTSRTIVVTAMSGVAATLLHGETTHGALALLRKIKNDEIEEWEDTRLVIIDEISFASQKDFEKMCSNLQKLKKQRYKLYGGVNMTFLGDYSQLVPIKQEPIYAKDNYCPEFHGALNCYIELNGKHRFKDDPEFGELNFRMREGNPTLDDIKKLNENCMVSENHQPNPNVQVATYFNKERDAVNASIFNRYCLENGSENDVYKGAMVIFMDDLFMNDNGNAMVPIKSNAVKRYFWESVGEADCHPTDINGPRKVDPLLKLYYRCPLMMAQNTAVSSGQANGSRVLLEAVRIKRNEVPFHMRLDTGVTIRAFFASQVKELVVKHESNDIRPRFFTVKSEKVKFKCHLKIGQERVLVKMSGSQFGLISNSCTTGHKLQGYTALELFVNEWAYHSNWTYVVLSRVRTMLGLFFRTPLSEDLSAYRMPEEMKSMLQGFRDKIGIKDLSDDDYNAFLRQEVDRMSRMD
jgi:AAA domain/Helitron helicase-like domain at N-terminus